MLAIGKRMQEQIEQTKKHMTGDNYSAQIDAVIINFLPDLEDKLILDACCGGRMFWYDKENPNALYVDRRVMKPKVVGSGKDARTRKCLPDVVMDFRKLELPDNTFRLVVFDPPHLFLGENSYMAQVYGRLDKQTWEEDIRQGFSECFRVLQNEGILIFKWNECDIPLKEILKLTDQKPLFGHPSGKAQKTHWICFMKIDSQKYL
jgi:SAM-dependent methyltransferase